MPSNYKVGLATAVRVGAVGPWTMADYEKRARENYAALGKPFVMVAIGPDGGMVHSPVFASSDKVATAYDRATNDPQHVDGLKGPAAYVAMFDQTMMDKNGGDALIESGFFVAENTRETSGPSNLALGLGIGATAIAGIIAFGKKKKAVV